MEPSRFQVDQVVEIPEYGKLTLRKKIFEKVKPSGREYRARWVAANSKSETVMLAVVQALNVPPGLLPGGVRDKNRKGVDMTAAKKFADELFQSHLESDPPHFRFLAEHKTTQSNDMVHPGLPVKYVVTTQRGGPEKYCEDFEEAVKVKFPNLEKSLAHQRRMEEWDRR